MQLSKSTLWTILSFGFCGNCLGKFREIVCNYSKVFCKLLIVSKQSIQIQCRVSMLMSGALSEMSGDFLHTTRARPRCQYSQTFPVKSPLQYVQLSVTPPLSCKCSIKEVFYCSGITNCE